MMQTPEPPPLELPLAGPSTDTHVDALGRERDVEIKRLVSHFYALARKDPLLGPVFESKVSDWNTHLASMRDFWSAAVYRTGRYRGRPLEIHMRIDQLAPEHFARWLQLWEQSVTETVRSGAGGTLIAMARQMAARMAPRIPETDIGSGKPPQRS